MTILHHNMVLEKGTNDDIIYYRILWIDNKQEIMYIFALNDNKALPIKLNIVDIISDKKVLY
ncbi:hypothetical protein [Bacillus rhizoplanae]|uniref:hypothetical protein n=1 Tax=Bacillus rhizoplanae TaxID=2880966 RepID=UPI003D219E56